MELRIGRLIDHVHLVVRDLDASKAFYRASIGALGRGLAMQESDDHFAIDELYVSQGQPVSHLHLAFQADDEATVRRWHAAVLAAGGRDNGAPGPRDYHPGYFAAFALDPDGNNVEAVFHGPSTRSADAVVVTADIPGAP